jgi:hypothetical protein
MKKEEATTDNRDFKLIAERELAKVLVISVRTLSRLREDGVLEFYKPGKKVYYELGYLDKLFEVLGGWNEVKKGTNIIEDNAMTSKFKITKDVSKRLREKGELPCVQVGNLILYKATEVLLVMQHYKNGTIERGKKKPSQEKDFVMPELTDAYLKSWVMKFGATPDPNYNNSHNVTPEDINRLISERALFSIR